MHRPIAVFYEEFRYGMVSLLKAVLGPVEVKFPLLFCAINRDGLFEYHP